MSVSIPKIAKSGKYLKIRFSFRGERYTLSDGYPDTKAGRKRAEATVERIKADIYAENLDTTLEKYKVHKKGESTANHQQLTYVQDVWNAYLEQRQKVVKASTYCKQFKPIDNYLRSLARVKFQNASKLVVLIQESKSPYTAKKILNQLSAACRWGMTVELCNQNPFDGLAKEIKLSKAQKSDEIEPLTKDERNRITRYFYTEKPAYAPFISFLFLTGCRPSEAVALEWSNVNAGVLIFDQVAVQGIPGKKIQEGTKTEPSRKFPINKQLHQLLSTLELMEDNTSKYVFTAPQGGLVNVTNLTNRHWKQALIDLGIKHRKLYQTRHTFITLCLEAGIDAKDVAHWVGNSPETIYSNYAGRNPNLNVPEL